MNGLTTKTARERLKQDGENELAAVAKRRPLRMFLGQFRDVMVLILLAATGISAFLGEITDAVTIILIVLLNAILGFLQEYRTEQTLESLRNLTAPTATACRDGKWQTIPARELVCGDLVRLEAGDNVPADSALIQAAGLAVNESFSPANPKQFPNRQATLPTPETTCINATSSTPARQFCGAVPKQWSLPPAHAPKWDRSPPCCKRSGRK